MDQEIKLRPQYEAACNAFVAGEKVERDFEALLLLHGIRPDVVANILEKSLDPGMAHNGLLWRGTYFAEIPIKINQYAEADEEWKGGKREKRYGAVRMPPTQ